MTDEGDITAHGYHKHEEVGRGSFGIVYRGTTVDTNRKVALKKMILKEQQQTEGIDFSAIREIRILRELSSDYLVNLVDVFIHRKSTHKNLYLVFEFMSTDLEALIKNHSLPLKHGDVKYYLYCMLHGLHFLQQNWIVHRDMKPANLLLSPSGELKIADFGLAKSFGRDIRLTPWVVTRWYRAPELLFGAAYYGGSVDMWSVGCILAEMLLRCPFFPGDSELDQLAKIFAAMGTPTQDQWPNVEELPRYVEFEECPPTPMAQIFTGCTDDTLDLISHLLKFNPNGRPTPEQALTHRYFFSPPTMTPPEKLLLPKDFKREKPVPPNNGLSQSVLPEVIKEEHKAIKMELDFS
eukprot:TRINITY_DN4984_c0_g1_i1.p1 TRINITY_DN4984_c0_g1~~TRINITY_DN4984_c0_g1_i1.p1  ORF type:complete len:382 (-),score=76.07 TRINITY_DN4984_c0_g1_i1:219-1271(-)